MATSYQRTRYAGTGTVGLASVSADGLIGNLPVFANGFRSFGRHAATSVVLGVALQFGPVQGSVSAGADTGVTNGFSGSLALSRPIQDEAGSTGWNLFATRQAGGLFLTADAQTRTGYGTPGIAVQSLGRTTTGIVTLRGSAGVVGGHPFLSDPVQGGLIVVDTGQPGIPVRMNGADRGSTSFDGKLAIGGAVPGTPQTVSLDTDDLPLDTVPTVTDGQATARAGGATVLSLPVRSTTRSAHFAVTLDGTPLPLGSTVVGRESSAPAGKDGRVYLPAITEGEVLRVDLPDGRTCSVDTHFDGRGGLSRRLGTLPCHGVSG